VLNIDKKIYNYNRFISAVQYASPSGCKEIHETNQLSESVVTHEW